MSICLQFRSLLKAQLLVDINKLRRKQKCCGLRESSQSRIVFSLQLGILFLAASSPVARDSEELELTKNLGEINPRTGRLEYV